MKSVGVFQIVVGVGSFVFGIIRANPVQIGVGVFLTAMGIVNYRIDNGK